MWVGHSALDDPTIIANNKYPFMLAKEADRRLWSLQMSETNTWRSPARFGSISAREINSSSADIVHLHWVTDGFMSVETIGAITKPIVWSLCDAWAFSGAEHYATDVTAIRSTEGYNKANRPPADSGLDIDRWTWDRKLKLWKTPMQLVPASTWLTTSVENSSLMGDWPITRIPHIVDTNVFAPIDQAGAREVTGIPSDRPVVLFLASGSINDHRKGWDLLLQAINAPEVTQPLTIVVVGPTPSVDEQRKIARTSIHSFQFFGEAHGDEQLVALYNSADLTAVPSREDNMPITAMESQSCGTPVVTFSVGGIPDIVKHLVSGYLAEPGNTNDLQLGVTSVINGSFRTKTRHHAIDLWSAEVVTPKLLHLYDVALSSSI
jgi:glycosyltransferase involved in cell wall biosynthesis